MEQTPLFLVLPKMGFLCAQTAVARLAPKGAKRVQARRPAAHSCAAPRSLPPIIRDRANVAAVAPP